jgi:hypothetical protein
VVSPGSREDHHPPAHSIQGFISTTGKKHRIEIEPAKNEADERVDGIGK